LAIIQLAKKFYFVLNHDSCVAKVDVQLL